MAVNYGSDQTSPGTSGDYTYQRRDTATLLYETINAWYKPNVQAKKKRRINSKVGERFCICFGMVANNYAIHFFLLNLLRNLKKISLDFCTYSSE